MGKGNANENWGRERLAGKEEELYLEKKRKQVKVENKIVKGIGNVNTEIKMIGCKKRGNEKGESMIM